MRRLKKIAVFSLILILSVCTFSVSADAYESSELSDAEAIFSEIYDAVDADTKAAIADLGLEEISFESLLSLSPRTVIQELLDVVRGKLREPLRALGMILAFIVYILYMHC